MRNRKRNVVGVGGVAFLKCCVDVAHCAAPSLPLLTTLLSVARREREILWSQLVRMRPHFRPPWIRCARDDQGRGSHR
jgi:hypothetical protein